MGVYARPDSPYWWIWLDGTTTRVNSKIRRVAATTAQTKENRLLAEAAYHALLGDVARDRFELPSTKAARTFEAQAAWYEEHELPKHGGAVQERWKLAHLRGFFGREPLDAITPTRWKEYESKRLTKDGVAPNTVGRELAILKSVLASAIGTHIEYHLLGQVKRRTTKVPAKRTITRQEEPGLLAALKSIDPELHDLYVVGVGTLLRQENLIYLQRSAHRGDRLVVQTKTGPHQVSLTGPTRLQRRAAKVLRARLPAEADGYFFPRWRAIFAPYEDPSQPGLRLRKTLQRAAKACGIPWGLEQGGIVWHTATRATGATRLLREHRIDVRTVQAIGGWGSLDQMAEYLGLDLDLLGLRRTA